MVTGGAAGIGLEIVRHLAGEGMCVVAIDRDPDACARARRTLNMGEDRVRIITGDIGTPDGARLAIETAIEKFGRLDLLCNNAAVHPLERIEEHKIGSYRQYRFDQRACALRWWQRLRRLQSGDHHVDQGLGFGSRASRGNRKLHLPRLDSYSGKSRRVNRRCSDAHSRWPLWQAGRCRTLGLLFSVGSRELR